MTSIATTADIRDWTRPGTDEVRRYIENWGELVGIEIYRRRNGNISEAYVDGDKVSVRTAITVISGKVWIDADDNLHLDDHRVSDILDVATKRERLLAALADNGIAAH